MSLVDWTRVHFIISRTINIPVWYRVYGVVLKWKEKRSPGQGEGTVK